MSSALRGPESLDPSYRADGDGIPPSALLECRGPAGPISADNFGQVMMVAPMHLDVLNPGTFPFKIQLIMVTKLSGHGLSI